MIILIIYASALVYEFTLIGKVTGSEVLTLIFLLFLIFRYVQNTIPNIEHKPLNNNEKLFYILSFTWFIGAVATDIYRQTPLDDVARGWSKIFFFVANFTVIRALIGKNLNHSILFIYFLFVSTVISLAFGIGDDLVGDQESVGNSVFGDGWKFGYGQFATISILLLSAKLNAKSFTRPLGIALPFASAALSLALNARNLFGITALSAVIGAVATGRRRAPSPVQIGTIGLVCVLLGFGLISIYSYAAGEGLIGPEAQDKYRHQSVCNLNLLVAGRTESLGSTQAIMDSPILGHGSWAHDMIYVQQMLSKLQESGIEIEGGEGYYGGDLIPTHSHLLGAWVEAGILGAVFWFWALWLAICAVYAAIRAPFSTTSFIVFIGLSLVWDIFFSPFGNQRRIITPAWLYLMMLVIERANEKLDRMRLEV